MRYILLLTFLFLSLFIKAQKPGASNINHDSTLTRGNSHVGRDSTNALACDTVNWIATKYDIASFSGGGNQPAPIPNDSLANSTISGIPLGSNLANLLNGLWILGGTYNGSANITLRIDSASQAAYFLRRSDSLTVYATPKQVYDSVAAHATGGTVTSVSGTTNRITSTGGTTPVIDISASYVGQTSITTLGTIGTGTWQGTSIDTPYTNAVSRVIGGTNISVSLGGKTVTVNVINNGSMFYADSVTFHGNTNITTLGGITSGTWSATAVGVAYGGTSANTALGARDSLNTPLITDIYSALGSVSKGHTVELDRINSASAWAGSSGVGIVIMVKGWLSGAITGFKWLQVVKGSQTNNNYNGIAMYKDSSGTLVLIDTTTRDNTIWQTANNNTIGSKALSHGFTASIGTVYYVILIANFSASSTIPSFGSCSITNTGGVSGDFTNSNKYTGSVTGQTSPSTSLAMSTVTGTNQNLIYIEIY